VRSLALGDLSQQRIVPRGQALRGYGLSLRQSALDEPRGVHKAEPAIPYLNIIEARDRRAA